MERREVPVRFPFPGQPSRAQCSIGACGEQSWYDEKFQNSFSDENFECTEQMCSITALRFLFQKSFSYAVQPTSYHTKVQVAQHWIYKVIQHRCNQNEEAVQDFPGFRGSRERVELRRE